MIEYMKAPDEAKDTYTKHMAILVRYISSTSADCITVDILVTEKVHPRAAKLCDNKEFPWKLQELAGHHLP